MIEVKNRTMLIPKIERTIGTALDENTEVRLFKINRYAEGTADISHLTFKLIAKNELGTENTIYLEKSITNDAIYLMWQIIPNDIGVSGTLLTQIKGFDNTGVCRWYSFIGPFYVAENIGGDIDISHLSDYEILQIKVETALRELAEANYLTAADLPIASAVKAGMIKLGYGLDAELDGTVNVTVEGGGGGTNDYQGLKNKPSIAGVTLSGNKSLEELGIQPKGNYLTPDDASPGGYYTPIVEDGILSWGKSQEDMPDVAPANIKGSDGKDGNDGNDGKTAYEYAVDGGYEGTEEEFAQKLAEEAVLKSDTVGTYEEIMACTEAGFVPDALAVKEMAESQNAKTEWKSVGSTGGPYFSATEKTIQFDELKDANEVLVRILVPGAYDFRKNFFVTSELREDATYFYRSNEQYASPYVRFDKSTGTIIYGSYLLVGTINIQLASVYYR